MIQSPASLPAASFFNNNDNYSTSFKSIFRYSSLPTDEINSNQIDDNNKESYNQFVIRQFILTTTYCLIILTLPISIWFTLKRIKPLERCIIYRLGKRLPIKGPGLVIVIPLIDVIDYIDLNPRRLCVLSKEQMLTSDGSLIEITDFIVEITVFNAVRTSTQLKDSRQNVEQFIKLSVINTIGGIHVEDLERKMEYIIRQYVETCNQHINKWGWSMVAVELPKIKVLSRAEPVNHVMKALKGYFGISEQSDCPATNLINPSIVTDMLNKENVDSGNGKSMTKQEQEIIKKLEKLASDYRYLSMLGISQINIALEIDDCLETVHYQFSPKKGEVYRIELQSNELPQIIVKASSWASFHEAIDEKDKSKVQIINNLV